MWCVRMQDHPLSETFPSSIDAEHLQTFPLPRLRREGVVCPSGTWDIPDPASGDHHDSMRQVLQIQRAGMCKRVVTSFAVFGHPAWCIGACCPQVSLRQNDPLSHLCPGSGMGSQRILPIISFVIIFSARASRAQARYYPVERPVPVPASRAPAVVSYHRDSL